jgi:hypothetical protein
LVTVLSPIVPQLQIARSKRHIVVCAVISNITHCQICCSILSSLPASRRRQESHSASDEATRLLKSISGIRTEGEVSEGMPIHINCRQRCPPSSCAASNENSPQNKSQADGDSGNACRNTTPRRFIRHPIVQSFLTSKFPFFVCPTLADWHISLSNRSHIKAYIKQAVEGHCPFGTG